MTWEQFVQDTLIPGIISTAWRLVAAFLILVVGTLLIKSVVKKLKKGRFAEKTEKTAQHFVVAFVRISLYVLLAVLVIATLGVPMASIVAVVGSAGLAISLAVQGTLSNLASGIMILVFKPFKEGDNIEAEGEFGYVAEVGIFYTTICTYDNKLVVVPNGNITTKVLKNHTAKETRRVDIDLTIAQGEDVESIRASALEIARAHQFSLADPAPYGVTTELKDGRLILSIRAWCESANYWTVKFDLTEQLHRLIADMGVKIPRNHVELHTSEGNQDK